MAAVSARAEGYAWASCLVFPRIDDTPRQQVLGLTLFTQRSLVAG